MKPFLTFILSISLLVGYGQQLEVDSEVFDLFTFGSQAADYGNDLQLDLTISYGYNYYLYRGKTLREFAGFKTHAIHAGFQDDALNCIDLYFKKLDDAEFDLLAARLEKKYGQATRFTALDKGVINAVEWKGENLTIQLYRYNNEATDLNDRYMTVFIITSN